MNRFAPRVEFCQLKYERCELRSTLSAGTKTQRCRIISLKETLCKCCLVLTEGHTVEILLEEPTVQMLLGLYWGIHWPNVAWSLLTDILCKFWLVLTKRQTVQMLLGPYWWTHCENVAWSLLFDKLCKCWLFLTEKHSVQMLFDVYWGTHCLNVAY